MDEGADGRRRFHCIGEPGVEGELRRLCGGGDQEGEGNEGKNVCGKSICFGEQVRNLKTSKIGIRQQRTCQQAHAADLRNDERLNAASHCFGIVIVEGDQAVGTERGDFPKEEGEQQIAAEDKPCHCADEEQDKEVIPAELCFSTHVIH